jgi:hypothetical protein
LFFGAKGSKFGHTKIAKAAKVANIFFSLKDQIICVQLPF